MNGEYRVGDVVLGNWTLTKLLGEGAYGKVYEAHREDFGTTYKAAVKIMTIPQSQSEVASARAEGMDDESVTSYFRSFVEDVVQEFALMSRLKGTANVVSYEDHSVTPHSVGIGWDILIRMELLTPMLNYMEKHQMTRSDVIKLGIDMCKALELCQKYNIIHRDIKPENIFISETGDYKLGDFGVARTLEKTTGGLSKKGTYTYMAPEIYRDEKYGSTVDIYSLGIVLYRLLNNNRAPFLPAPPQPITHSERERALVRRISGEALPAPANAEGRLAEIVLKACAYEPKERYTSPLQMRQELEAIQYQRNEDSAIYGRSGKIDVDSAAYTKRGDSAEDKTVYEPHRRTAVSAVSAADGEKTIYEAHKGAAVPEQKAASTVETVTKKRKSGLIAAIAGGVVLIAALLILLLPKLAGEAQNEPVSTAQSDIQTNVQNNAENDAETDAETDAAGAEVNAAKSSGQNGGTVSVDSLSDLNESWDVGALRVTTVDENKLHVEITDNRVPDNYVLPDEPGDESAPCWRFMLTLDTGDTWAVETYLGIDLTSSEKTTLEFCRSGATSPRGFVLNGKTSSFDVYFDYPPYTVSNIQAVSVQMVREFRSGKLDFTDEHRFIVDSAWHELPIVLQGDGLQILSCRYIGGPEIKKIEFFNWGGINGGCEFDTYFADNDQITYIVGAAYFGGPISDEDIEMYRPFAEKMIREADMPLGPQNPIAINYGPILASDMTKLDNSDFLLWFGVNKEGEMVSTIIVEVGVPVEQNQTASAALSESVSAENLPGLNDSIEISGTVKWQSSELADEYAQLEKTYPEYEIADATVLVFDKPYSFVDDRGRVVTLEGAILPSSDIMTYINKHVTIQGRLNYLSDKSFQEEIYGPYKPDGYIGSGLINFNPYGPYMLAVSVIEKS